MRHREEGVEGLMDELGKFKLSFADLGREEYQCTTLICKVNLTWV